MADQRLSELTEAPLYDDTEIYTQRSGISAKTDIDALTTAISGRIDFPNTGSAVVTYENLNTNGDIGQIASTVAAGNDNRFPTSNEKAALNVASASTSNKFVVNSGLNSAIANVSADFILIQGTIDKDANNPATHIDSTMVAEPDNPTTWLGTVYCSSLNAGNGGTTQNWSDVLPLVVPTGTKHTLICGKVYDSYSNSGTDENTGNVEIHIDWVSGRVNGWAMYQNGDGLNYQTCFRFTGTINSDISGVRQNGYYNSARPSPLLGTSTTTITKLPAWDRFMNFGWTIEHKSY